MVRKLRRKGDASAAPTPRAVGPGSAKPGKFKKKAVKTDPEKLKAAAAESAGTAEASASARGSAKPGKFKKAVKTDPEKLKAAAAESAGTAEASASAPTPAPKPKPVEASPAAVADNGGAAQRKWEDRKASGKETMKGREEEVKGEDRKTSRKETTEGREEERVRREEKRRRTSDKEDDDGERGFIFMCNARTKPECYRNGVFGLPRGKMDVVEKIQPGAKLFLYDFDLKLMYGVYKADTGGGLDLVRHAFEGKFPAQVKFSVDMDCLPVPEKSFKHAIKENYNSKGRFTQELSPKQVHRLLAIFKPIGLSQPAPQRIEETRRPHIVEDRREPYDYDKRQIPQHIEETHRPHIVEDRRELYDYDGRRLLQRVEERCAPIHVRAYPLEDHYKITPSLLPPLPGEPRHSLVLDPYHIQEPQHVPPKYYHQVATSSYHQPHMDILHERTGAEATIRDPPLARDYGALPGELAARSEHVDELYRSYKLSTRAMDLHPAPSYARTYENPPSLYSESLERPVLTRVRGPTVPVSSRYSFVGPPTTYE